MYTVLSINHLKQILFLKYVDNFMSSQESCDYFRK